MSGDRYAGLAAFRDDRRAYGFEDTLGAFEQAGLRAGDSLFVHSELNHFGKLADIKSRDLFIDFFLDALLETLGPSGNLLVPTFSYSYCKSEIYDPLESPSTVGIATERFRKMPGVVRSHDAIFSAAALGPKKERFTLVGQDCFGPGSVFEKLFDENAKIVFLGERFDLTFMHFVEQRLGVAYRYFKEFPGQSRLDGRLLDFTFRYFVRDLKLDPHYDLEGIARFLGASGVLQEARLGASKVRVVGARDAYAALEAGIKQDSRLLLVRS